MLYIAISLRASPPAAGPPVTCKLLAGCLAGWLVGLWKEWIGRIGWIWVAKSVILRTWSLHFGILEEHFGELGAHRDIVEDPLGPGFDVYQFWEDFGILMGAVLSSFCQF